MSLSQITIADCRLTRDAETKATTGGQTVLHFSVAADRRTKKDGKWGSVATFWDCDLWGKQGEAIAQYMTKGKLISLTGEAYIDAWEQDGVKKMKAKINCDRVEFAPVKSEKKDDGFKDDVPEEVPF